MVSAEPHLEHLGGDIQPRDERRKPTLAFQQVPDTAQPLRFELLFHHGGDLAQEAIET
jgi:hypothetical protein